MFNATRFYTVDFVETVDVMTGQTHRFTVYHDGTQVKEIRYADGCRVPASSEQFTETAEAFFIDRAWKVLEESDVQGYARRAYC